MIDADVETFDALIREGPVLVDIWGPQCRPCLTLMPAVEALAERYRGRVRVVKVNAPDNRKICRDLRVAGLPAYLTMRDGVEVERLTSSTTTPAHIEEAIERLLDGAPAVGPPVPEHLRNDQDGQPRPPRDLSAVRPRPPRDLSAVRPRPPRERR